MSTEELLKIIKNIEFDERITKDTYTHYSMLIDMIMIDIANADEDSIDIAEENKYQEQEYRKAVL